MGYSTLSFLRGENMNSKKIKDWVAFLMKLDEKDVQQLALAIDRYFGNVNAADPDTTNLIIRLDGEVNPHAFRANVKEGWVEQFAPLKTNTGKSLYDVKNGHAVVERKYGKVEIVT